MSKESTPHATGDLKDGDNENLLLLRDALMAMECLSDVDRRVGSLKVGVPKDGRFSQLLVDYLQEDLIPRIQAALRLAEEKQ